LAKNKSRFIALLLAMHYHMPYVVYMNNNYDDSLDRLAHLTGMTDLEYEAQQKALAQIARFDRLIADVRNSDEPAPMTEVHHNHEEPRIDAYDDYDYGYHDQYEQ
jgi:hypothetical protein